MLLLVQTRNHKQIDGLLKFSKLPITRSLLIGEITFKYLSETVVTLNVTEHDLLFTFYSRKTT